MISINKYLY